MNTHFRSLLLEVKRYAFPTKIIHGIAFFALNFLLCNSAIFSQSTQEGNLCFVSTVDDPRVSAKIEWTIDNIAKTVKLRTTFAKTFVDNTYGTTAIGWPGGHKFGDLVGSDHVQLALYDKNGVKKLEFKQDYITASAGAPSGYDCLGVTGGEGQMIVGSSASILSATSSLDQNMNTFGYVLTTNSPLTDANYTPNPTYPNWIYDVWYEITVDLNAFGAAGFGTPLIASVHASPSKTGNNTEPVDSMRCPDLLELNVNSNCIQDCSEDIIATVNSSNSPFTYLWSTGATTKDLMNVCAGTYSMTVTDNSGKTASATVTVEDAGCPGGDLCFKSSTGDNRVGAKIEWTINGSNNTVTIRTIFAKTFVDNTYGTTAIGWPGGHKFGDLVGSDHVQLALYDKNGVKKLEFKQDYITASASAPSGYDCLGVTGGEGQMIVGSASSIKSATTSLDQNFNTYGYVLTANSPLTDVNYTPNPSYPNWIYDVWYETTVDLAAFGAAGFGFPLIASVHASPSKTGNNTEPVDSMKCPNFVEITVQGNCIQDCSEDLITTVNSTNPPFTYLWSTGATTKDIFNKCAGVYSVTVTDSKGNTGSATATVTDASCPADSLCFKSTTGDPRVTAKIGWTLDQTGKKLIVRTTFSKKFVDNTYGTTAIGWPGGHTFSNLVGSDHVQLALYDKLGVKKLEFKQDYITASAGAPSGYDCLGVTGGEGQMIVGSAASILSATSSLDQNFNTYGYILTTNSPATDTNYTPNPSYPNWIYDVWYETVVDLNAFGAAGFGFPLIASVHASPSKTGNNTEPVDSMDCVMCSISAVSTNVSNCVSPGNTYSVSGLITLNTNIVTGTLIISDGAFSQTFLPPFTSPIAYTLTGLPADGSIHTLTAKFSVDTSCKFIKTYTAPPPCGPKITHEKNLISVTKAGLNTYNVVYNIVVTNTGGAGTYDLKDRPAFDDDIAINSVSYFSNAPGNPGSSLFGPGPWMLANDQAIAANSSQTYTLLFNVTIDLNATSSGNNIYYKCGQLLVTRPSSGEALFNESQLDINNDGINDQLDTACADLPYIVHTKSFAGLVQTGLHNYTVQYQIKVENIGGATGTYNLSDRPAFDNDITILGANYSTNAPANPGNPGPSILAGTGPWSLASDAVLNAGSSHTYNLNVNININLEDANTGDNRYDQCGRVFANTPISGEGLFNESSLDVNDDGITDQRDTACADVPYILHEKTAIGVIQTGTNTFRVTYQIRVRNIGGASGNYNLSDSPYFDDDVTIVNANFSSNAAGNPGNPGPIALAGSGPWSLASNQLIASGGVQTYTLTANIVLDLTLASGGDNIYHPCSRLTPVRGEGLFNEALLTVNGFTAISTVCVDIPNIVHTKSLVGVTLTGLNTYQVVYNITVENKGGATGLYSLTDAPNFDNDITILSSNYSSNAPGNIGNPGPIGLPGTGPWTLATNQSIAAGAIQTYTIRVSVQINLEGGGGDDRYDVCGNAFITYPKVGEGLFNESRLDINSDGTIDQKDTACADLPFLLHDKTILGVTQTGPRNFQVLYKIAVRNIGGVSTSYALSDRPAFDNDIVIGSASYTSDVAGHISNPGPIGLPGSGPWTLNTNQNILPGAVHSYFIRVNVSINLEDLTGDNRYDRCGRQFVSYPVSGEGLFNESRLDIYSDGTIDQRDTVCADLPYIVHTKSFSSIADLGGGNYRVVYRIDVNNLGGASGLYDLNDAPSFDDDFTILSASYTTNAAGHPANPGPVGLPGSGPWNLANDQLLAAFGSQAYFLTVNVNIDLINPTSPGDEFYRPCGYSIPGIPVAGEGLFNESRLDVNNDGTPDQKDTACADIPKIVHTKTLVGVTPTGVNTYQVEYKIVVENKGGVLGQYRLVDAPNFDNDITILGANYRSDVAGHPSNPGPLPLAGTGPWTLSNNQSIAGGGIHTYYIRVQVQINLEGGGGDDRYDYCGKAFIAYPKVGEGLFNESLLDINSDGSFDQRDTACADLPYIIHDKTFVALLQTGFRTYQATYKITVRNIGGANGFYGLEDRPAFDNDITITTANFGTDAPANPANPGPVNLIGTGPWTLATNQFIGAGSLQTYTIRVNFGINLEGGGGDDRYDYCGKQFITYPSSGEGLFNESRLDVNTDGVIDRRDTACYDVPYIVHEKTAVGVVKTGFNTFRVTYQIRVRNLGGLAGNYDLNDTPYFDDDVTINSASYSSTAPGVPGGPLFGIGPWALATNQLLGAGGVHFYTVTVNATLDLTVGSGGDNIYHPCTRFFPVRGEGLFNESRLTVNGFFAISTVCLDIPDINHTKSLVGITPLGVNTYQVEYKITVENKGGVSGIYALTDAPNFDNDITILSANYRTDVAGHIANPGPLPLAGTGPWTLTTNQSIPAFGVQNYYIRVVVQIDLEGGGGDNRYDYCAKQNVSYPKIGEGLFNESRLDIESDGTVDQRDTACGDLPYILHEKRFIGLSQTGFRSYQATYQITVRNIGGANGFYGLEDRPAFDNDITITGANFNTDAPSNPANPGPVNLIGTGPWTLATNQFIGAGVLQTYTLRVNFNINLEGGGGDDRYDYCGKQFISYPISGEGLFNESRLDVNTDGVIDRRDTACYDVPYIVHEKTAVGVVQTGFNTFRVTYQIRVRNLGGLAGNYDLNDSPYFDDDITINSASYNTSAPGVPGGALFGSGPWTLATNVPLGGGGVHLYNVTVNITLDLTVGSGGDNIYRPCTRFFPVRGEGLFNESRLTVNGFFAISTVCIDIPNIVHTKSLVGVTPTGFNTYQVEYKITVENKGGVPGVYALADAPNFENDITILGANYRSDVAGHIANPGPLPLVGTGPWTLTTNQTIAGGAIHSYYIRVNVQINLEGGGGDDRYDACGKAFISYPKTGEGLFNESILDINSDGTVDQRDTACADLPYIVHEKTAVGVVQTGVNTFRVTYQVRVRNLGGVTGNYNLFDQPYFDDDVNINSASYTSTAAGVLGGPLFGSGPWTLATNEPIGGGSTHIYTVSVNITLDLTVGSGGDNIYRPCSRITPVRGEGLFNEARLVVNGFTAISTVCVDIPNIVHKKSLVGVTQTGLHTFQVTYKITVENKGGAAGTYALVDAPNFENDITILSSNYQTDAPGNIANPGPVALAGSGPWLIANNQSIAGGSLHTYTLRVNVLINMEGGAGDDRYDACGKAFIRYPKTGEGLFNESGLDINSDGSIDQRDTACADLPYIVHEKTAVGVVKTGFNSFRVSYQIRVRNLGGATGAYNLSDSPYFDDDVNIISASYTSNAPGAPGGPLFGNGPWLLALNEPLGGGSTHVYNLTVNLTLDLTVGSGGDNIYRPCTRFTPVRGEGLFNEARLEVNGYYAISTACTDIPNINHTKRLVGVTQTGVNTYQVQYRIVVENKGGITGQYNLSDAPNFDNDITILSANYRSDAPGNGANPGPVSLFGSGPWTLATNQTIPSLGVHTYNIYVNVQINLEGGGGDDRYDACGKTFITYPKVGEGLFNESRLDIDSDGSIDQRDTACADLPYIVHQKTAIGAVQTGVNKFRVTYEVRVRNLGGLSGSYDLSDTPFFDDDVNINSASYTSNAPGNPGGNLFGTGPWTLATNQLLGGGQSHLYTITVNVTLDLTFGSTGDNVYRPCDRNIPVRGQGLFNEAKLNVNGYISISTGCTDIPDISHEKSLVGITPTGVNTYQVEYKITVQNKGGVSGKYNLIDVPTFDNDITILGANYRSDAPGNGANPGPLNLAGTGPWTLATNQNIAALSVQTYYIRVNVQINLEGGGGDDRYDACGKTFVTFPKAGEGLFNESRLDIESDGTIDQRDTACGDLPYILHEKILVGVTQTGARTFHAIYKIVVRNIGGTTGTYALSDRPAFDNDIQILNASLNSDAPGNFANPGPWLLSGTGPWQIANAQTIFAGATHNYTIRVNLAMDLEDGIGDNRYDQCGKQAIRYPVPGEGLFNESRLDLNSDGSIDRRDTVCGDIPYIVHTKSIVDVFNQGNGNYRVVYRIDVRNLGGVSGNYDLVDAPAFDDDVVIQSTSFTTNAPSNPANPGPQPLFGSGPWNLANNQFIAAYGSQYYLLSVNVNIDLVNAQSPGNEVFTRCGSEIPGVPIAGEGLFNESLLDVNRDGYPDQRDTACTNVDDYGALGDKVWVDVNYNGLQDVGEPRVPNVIVYLYDCSTSALVMKDTTDANGCYFFERLPANRDYYVRFDQSTIPPGHIFTKKDMGTNDAIDSDVNSSGVGPCTRIEPGERDSTYDAGLLPYATLGDFVWHDKNGDGMQSVGEPGIRGISVWLYDAVTKAVVKTTTTDSNGLYLFKDLLPGDYYIKFQVPSGWVVTKANNGPDYKDSDLDNSNGAGTTATKRLTAGEDDRTWDLGLLSCIMISGDVWFDQDMDGIYDWEEKGINGLYVYLVNAMTNEVVATTTTSVKPGTPSDDGYYKFCASPGMYYVRFERPGNLGASEPYKGTDPTKDSDITHENGLNTTRKYTVASGDMLAFIGAGFQTKSQVGDKVWVDQNFNGVQEINEAPLPGVKVAAYKPNGTMVSEGMSANDGSFNLDGMTQGDYYVKFTLPTNSYGFTVPNASTDDKDSDVDGTYGYGTTKLYRIMAGEVRPTVDAGVVAQALAVEWLAFDAENLGAYNHLSWSTRVDLHNDYFIVERRFESDPDFVEIGKVEANANFSLAQHDYAFDDRDIQSSGMYYYRLKQVDKVGRETYSKIVSVKMKDPAELSAIIYPNPAGDHLNIEMWIPQEGALDVKVLDQSGKEVIAAPFSGYHAKGKFKAQLDLSDVPSGAYVIQFTMASGVVNKKFAVSR